MNLPDLKDTDVVITIDNGAKSWTYLMTHDEYEKLGEDFFEDVEGEVEINSISMLEYISAATLTKDHRMVN